MTGGMTMLHPLSTHALAWHWLVLAAVAYILFNWRGIFRR
jgi:hypothetical protein